MRTISCLLLLLLCLVIGLISCDKGSFGEKTTGSGIVTGDYSSAPGTTGLPGNGNGDSTQHEPGVLTSGEWNDHDHWDFWLGLMSKDTFATAQTEWGFYCGKRWAFEVTDAFGAPVPDAVVTILKGNNTRWECHTNKFGTARYVPVFEKATDLPDLQYKITYNGQTYSAGHLPADNTTITCTINNAAQQPTIADVMFVVDATGSMGDEITYLQTELYDVLNTAAAHVGSTQLRYSSVFYRDQGDEYLTRAKDFTNNAGDVISFIKDQAADGGGDFPEAVEEALTTAMQQQWSANARARIMFLVLDAPPHSDVQIMNTVHDKIQEAAAKGITIIPLAASGVDKSTEFLLRFMAIATNGTYTFLTNDSGVGDTHLTPTIGAYDVEFLNQQMVRLIVKYAGE